jgi:hypothetical protein
MPKRPVTMVRNTHQDLQGAQVFGVAYQKADKSAQHNVAIRNVDGTFRVYDSQRSELEALDGSTAADALKDFMSKHAQSVPGFGLAFEYLVARQDGRPHEIRGPGRSRRLFHSSQITPGRGKSSVLLPCGWTFWQPNSAL